MSRAVRHGVTKTCLALLALLPVASARGATTAAAAKVKPDLTGGYASTHILVKFTAGTFSRDQRGSGDGRGSKGRLEPVLSPALRAACAEWGVTRVRPRHPQPFGNPSLAARLGLDRTFVVEVPKGTDVVVMAAKFRSFAGEIETAEIDGICGVAAVIPNDTFFADTQWNMHNTGQTGGRPGADVDAPLAWDFHTGHGGSVTIAIIDTGVTPHVDFADRMVAGTNIVNPGSSDTTDAACPHGTHVAGIAAAEGNNGLGVAGMNWGALIMPVRVLPACTGDESDIADGIVWAVNHGADICNVSLESFAGTFALKDAVDYAYGQGVLTVAAAGNNGDIGLAYPARFPNCMSVSATDHNDDLWWWSSYGPGLDVAAPGQDILSTWPVGTDAYVLQSGTSMATSHVSGLASLIKSYVPGLTATEIRTIITTTAEDLGPTGWDSVFGYGRINACSAMVAADNATIRIVSSVPPDGAIDAGQPFDPSGNNPSGWDRVQIAFDGSAQSLLPTDFSVSTVSSTVSEPLVINVVPDPNAPPDSGLVTVILDRVIDPMSWTTIHHGFSGTSVRLGFLPGDVNNDGTSDSGDILSLIEGLNGAATWEVWQNDIDRAGESDAADLLRLIDLLHGAGLYQTYLDQSLPN